jgi:DNA-directed RNA polymerase specialized sigma24 family protein
VVTLRDVDGYRSDEVCGLLNISAANQRVLLHRGRAALRAERLGPDVRDELLSAFRNWRADRG